MAGRPPKKGIDYSGWSVNIFDNDTKIDKLLDAQGWIGFGIYFYLCQRAYGSEGYYYQWCYDDCASTSRKMGGSISAGTVKETVDYCLQIGLFDKGLFDRWGVLTSRGIQRRYWEVVKGRDVRSVISDYWLLQDDECKGLLKIPLNINFQGGKANFPSGNSNNQDGKANFPTIKKSKVKESKVNKNTIGRFTPPSVEEVAAYCKSRNNRINANEFIDFYSAKGWMIGKNRMKDWKAAVRTWEQRRKESVKKASFNNFQQNDYDFNQLETELMSN